MGLMVDGAGSSGSVVAAEGVLERQGETDTVVAEVFGDSIVALLQLAPESAPGCRAEAADRASLLWTPGMCCLAALCPQENWGEPVVEVQQMFYALGVCPQCQLQALVRRHGSARPNRWKSSAMRT